MIFSLKFRFHIQYKIVIKTNAMMRGTALGSAFLLGENPMICDKRKFLLTKSNNLIS